MAKEVDTGEWETAEGVVWREEARRFETPDGEAFLQYRLLVQPRQSSRGGVAPAAVMDMVHTYVPGRTRGQGLTARLCDAAFGHMQRNAMHIVPTCSYISDTYLPRNRAWNELVYDATRKNPKPEACRRSVYSLKSRRCIAAMLNYQIISYPADRSTSYDVYWKSLHRR